MANIAHFSVDARLARLLGESYRSSEAAIKELVDNAWDADAANVWVTLPAAMTSDPIVIQDDGSGMTSLQVRNDYLNIASDKRTRVGERASVLNRRIKGRKGIGKFAGLTIAGRMEVITETRGRRATLIIDKNEPGFKSQDLLAVALPLVDEVSTNKTGGTTIKLSLLDHRLNFPTPDRLREMLIHEYGREEGFLVYVNDVPLSLIDIPGPTVEAEEVLPEAGQVGLRFTIFNGKRNPRFPGITIRVNGKTVGKPVMFGLDDDEDIPVSLSRRIFGEVNLVGLEDFVTADWSGFIENSKAFQEVENYVRSRVKTELKLAHAQEMALQRARLQREINRKIEKLPEHRRDFARDALNRILVKFYGESDERVSAIIDVALDAMEHDSYWAVIEQVHAASRLDVASLAASLDIFGITDLAIVSRQAKSRLDLLDFFQKLIERAETLEKDVHLALEKNLWILGQKFSLMSSNKTLAAIIETYCKKKFSGKNASKRPDLLLTQGFSGNYLIIELKRPSHTIAREDIAQAEEYRDELIPHLPSGADVIIMLIGKSRVETIAARNLNPNIEVHSYSSLIGSARHTFDWIFKSAH